MAVIKLVGPSYTTEGQLAVFSVALDSDPLTTPLAIGGSVTFTLDTNGASATEGNDFASLLATDLKSSDPTKISLGSISTDATTGRVTVTATNISGGILARGTSLLTFALATKPDLSSAESTELYNVQLTSTSDTVSGTGVVSTRIERGNGRILNWGASVGNRTIDASGVFLVPELESERFARTGQALPSNLVGLNDYNLGFAFTTDATGTGTFTLDGNGLKITSGYTTYPTATDNAGSFVVGRRYSIASTGNTDFTLIGAANNNPGTVFIATGAGTGTGTAEWNRNDITINAGELEIGRNYTISTTGTTDFTTVGANNSLPGTSFIATGTGSGTGSAITVNETNYLYAIGYPTGALSSGVYINALDLTTIRLGSGNDFFGVIGTGITQSVRADISIDSSKGYVFQSSIFAGSGDDTLRVLMPWQSIFKGGSNTTYYDAVNGTDPGNAIGITLSNALTLEEVPYGDLIELKGSRFDWDIEFKDGNSDGSVTLESILDERDYLAVANNNQISGFERIKFGDILFDLVLYRQQQSSVVYGQPEYYLNGLENLAPELNSDITSGSKLWEAFRFNRTKLQGITGTATDPTDVFTGDTNDTPFIVGALRFASLNTEAGNDIVEIGTSGQTSVDQASIDLGSGTDQLKVNGLFSRSSVKGGTGADNIILTTVSNATVDGGDDGDVVEITTSVSQTVFTGGDGNDVLILPGTYASYLLTSSVTGDVITFNDGFGNSITGVETIKFSDINLDALQQLSLTGPGTIDEGIPAAYTVKLFKPPIDPPVNAGAFVVGNRYEILTIGTTDYTLLGAANNTIGTTFTATATGSGTGTATNIVLLAGESAAFSLQLSGSGSNPTNVFTDLAALVTSSLQASAGIVLKNISVDNTTGLIRAVATAARDLTAGTDIATLSVPVNADLLTETPETFQVTLRDFGSLVPSTQQIETAITDVPPVTIKLVGPSAAVTEGSSANYKVLLDAAGLSLGTDRSVSFTLDSSSGTATKGSDFVALSAGVLTPNSTAGVTLTTSSGPNGSITVTATNNGSETLAAGGELLRFAVETNTDTLAESSENFSVTLSSSSAVISSGAAVVNATIADQVPAIKIRLDPSQTTSIIEGSTASFLVSLDSTALKAGEQVRLRLDSQGLGDAADLSAKEGTDFAALIAAGLTPVNGISLSAISTSRNGSVTLTATNTGGFDLPSDTPLLSFNVTTSNDVAVEGDETFRVTLRGLSPSAATTGADEATVTITDNDTAAIKLTGATTIAEGGSANYAVSLDGVGLGSGRSLTITLDSSGLTANESSDFAALLAGSLLTAAGISPSAISTAANGAVTLTLTNTGGSDLAAGAQLLSFSLAATGDILPEINETFSISLSSSSATVTAGTITTTINDDDVVAIQINGSASVAEGAGASYTVDLNGVGLGVGRSVTFTLDSQGLGDATGLTAKENSDFTALLASALIPSSGLSLATSAGSNGALIVTATNTGTSDLAVNSRILSFSLATTADLISEANETFSVSLASSSATVGTGAVTTTITDDDSLAVRIIGPTTVEEGASTAAYTVSLGSTVGLGAGRSVQFSLDSASGSANEGIDYSALVASSLRAAAGITLSTTAGAGGLLNITATRTGNADLEAGANLLSFAINTTLDNTNEAAETFTVTLAGAAGASVEGSAVVSTSISEDTGPFRRVLNYGRSVGNVTIQPGVFVAAPLTVEEGFAQDGISYPTDVPKELVGGFDYGLYFEYFRDVTLGENGNVTSVTNRFNRDQSTGLKVSRDGLIRYSPDSGQNDNLIAIGHPVGSLTSGVYINALELTTIRMGAGDDSFSLTGEGITQKLSAEVSKEASAGYIFQSSIFAEAGDDTVSVLMPFQSRFSGGTNTPYRDAIFDPSGTGTPITLSASLTVEEISLGDLIELKGSRYDWDIEFKDGPDAGTGVSLASILDDSNGDYLAISNNNQVSGFERIRFADILFDLILARQQDSAAVFGQPDYYLIGAEKEAPELNSDINQNSQLWEAFRFNRTKLQAIVGTATDSVDVFTGDARDTPYLVGALKFASLNTEGGDDIAVIGSGEQAAVNLGSGNDQLEVKGAFTRSSVDGGDGNDGIILATVSNAAVITGAGDDIVSVLTEINATILNGGAGTADQLLLPTTFAASALTSTVSAGTVNFSDAFGNSITGFESIKFSDITLDALETLTLTGPAAPTKIEEGSSAAYDIGLTSSLNGGNGLQTGQSVAFTLKISNGTDANPANISTDLGAITSDLLTAAPGLVLRSVNVDAGSGLIRVLASAATTIAAGSRIATLTLPVIADLLAETDESFGVSLKDFVQTVAVTTTISNVAPATIRLVDISPTPGTALEGASASYAVELDGVGLAVGRAVTITLDSSSGTATEAVDFPALVAARLTAATGVTLGTPTVDPTTGAVTITLTNTGATALPAGARLLTFQMPISVDTAVEGDETYTVSLTSTTAAVSAGLITSTIRDLVPTPIISLSGQSTVSEGLSAAYAVSLTGGGLLPGQSFTLTLAATGGTATAGIDFVALLLEGALTAGEGITLGKVSVNPATKAASLTVTNSSQKALPVGAQLLSFNVATIADSAAESNETYTINLSSNSATVTTATVTTTITETPVTPTVTPPATPGTGVSFNPGTITVGSSGGSSTPAAQTASFSDTGVKTLAELTNNQPLKPDAKALLTRYTVNPTNSSTPVTAAEETASFIDFSINVGGLQTIVAEIELAKEVKANAYVKVNPNTGEAFDFTFDPITGLGAELLDKNNNGLVDNLRIHLRDGALGDVDGQFNGQIRDPGVLAEAPRVAVYRFYRNGIHFYTTDESERDNIIARSYGNGVGANDLNGNPKAKDLITGGLGYQYEGVAYEALDTQGTALYRFFNPVKGYHFMTTNADEALNVIRNSVGSSFNLANAQGQTLLANGWGYQYEGRSYKVSTIAQTGMNTPVYRFYNRNKGVHFYSSSLEEAKSVVANSLGAAYATDSWITSTTEALKQNPLTSTPAPLANGWGYQFEGAGFFV